MCHKGICRADATAQHDVQATGGHWKVCTAFLARFSVQGRLWHGQFKNGSKRRHPGMVQHTTIVGQLPVIRHCFFTNHGRFTAMGHCHQLPLADCQLWKDWPIAVHSQVSTTLTRLPERFPVIFHLRSASRGWMLQEFAHMEVRGLHQKEQGQVRGRLTLAFA